MDERELAEPVDPEAWDWASAQRLPPIPRSEHRSQFVIELDFEQVERVDAAAQRAGEGIIAFMRRAILDRADAYAPAGSDADPGAAMPAGPTAADSAPEMAVGPTHRARRGRNGAEQP